MGNVNIDKQLIFQAFIQHQDTLQKLGVNRLGLFGSFVRCEEKPNSDIDILVEFLPGEETFRNLINLHSYLNNLFGRNIEIVTTNSLSPYIGPYILEEVEYAPFNN
jgi:predicted nucleotidyltransferase